MRLIMTPHDYAYTDAAIDHGHRAVQSVLAG